MLSDFPSLVEERRLEFCGVAAGWLSCGFWMERNRRIFDNYKGVGVEDLLERVIRFYLHFGHLLLD